MALRRQRIDELEGPWIGSTRSFDNPIGDQEPRAWIPIAATLFLLALAIRLVCYTGLIGSDDLWYAAFARRIAEGSYQLVPHHFDIRYGLLLPTAATFRIFGVHEWTMVVVPLVASSLAVAFTALIALRLAGPVAAWSAGVLMATLPVDVRYASVLVPEPVLQAVVLGGAILFLAAERRRSDLLAAASGVLLAMGYLTKETGAFVAVAFFAYALLRRHWRLAGAFAIGVALVLTTEALWYWSQSGDPLFRFHALGTHNESDGAAGANGMLFWRLFKAYPHLMLIPNSNFALHSLVGLILAAGALVRPRLPDKVLFLVLWALVPFLYLNFGSTSTDRYWVIPAGARYIVLLYPPIFILAGITLARSMTVKWRTVATAAVAVICGVGVFTASTTRSTGHNTAHVNRLKELVITARLDNLQICGFESKRASDWRMTVRILAPERMGCDGNAIWLVADSNGLPTAATAPTTAGSR